MWCRSVDNIVLSAFFKTIKEYGGVDEATFNSKIDTPDNFGLYYYPCSYLSIQFGASCIQFKIEYFNGTLSRRTFIGGSNSWTAWQ